MTERARLSARIAAIAESATLKVDAKAKALQAEGRPVISYAAGEPDFATTFRVADSAMAAMRAERRARSVTGTSLRRARR